MMKLKDYSKERHRVIINFEIRRLLSEADSRYYFYDSKFDSLVKFYI